MTDWLERVAIEKQKLDKKIELLITFQAGGTHAGMSGNMKALLQEQLEAMEKYSNILMRRMVIGLTHEEDESPPSQ